MTQLARESLRRQAWPTSGEVVTGFQSDSSRTDSPVRVLHAQPRSPVSARQKVNVARTMASERARGCCCACFVFALQWKPLIIVGRYRRAFSRAWTSLPLPPFRLHLRRRVHARLRAPVTSRPSKWPPPWFKNLLAKDNEPTPSVFVIEAWIGKRWRLIARSDYEAAAFRLFNQASYACPVETLLRLRRGSEVLIKMPADGRGNVRE